MADELNMLYRAAYAGTGILPSKENFDNMIELAKELGIYKGVSRRFDGDKGPGNSRMHKYVLMLTDESELGFYIRNTT